MLIDWDNRFSTAPNAWIANRICENLIYDHQRTERENQLKEFDHRDVCWHFDAWRQMTIWFDNVDFRTLTIDVIKYRMRTFKKMVKKWPLLPSIWHLGWSLPWRHIRKVCGSTSKRKLKLSNGLICLEQRLVGENISSENNSFEIDICRNSW